MSKKKSLSVLLKPAQVIEISKEHKVLAIVFSDGRQSDPLSSAEEFDATIREGLKTQRLCTEEVQYIKKQMKKLGLRNLRDVVVKASQTLAQALGIYTGEPEAPPHQHKSGDINMN